MPSSASLLAALEADEDDVLEVTNLDRAIAKAEAVIRERSSRVLHPAPDSSAIDLFESLATTDDTSGPALHLPYVPTPVPPPIPGGLTDTPTPYAMSVALRATNSAPRFDLPSVAASSVAEARPKASKTVVRGKALHWITALALAAAVVAFAAGGAVGGAAGGEGATSVRSTLPSAPAVAPILVEAQPHVHMPERASELSTVRTPREATLSAPPVIDVRALKDAPPRRHERREHARR